MKQVIEVVDKQSSKIIALAKELINIPTVNPPGLNYKRFIDFLDLQCRQAGLSTKRYVVSRKELEVLGIREGSPRINLIARWNTGAKKTLHINAHYDVVPAGGKWDTNPFKAVVKQGKLFGRGSEDMKSNIACMVFAVRALKESGILPSVNIEFSFTPDEETGGYPGLEYLLKKKAVSADYALGEGYEGDYIAIGNKGMLWLEVEILGKPAHSSTPYRGENAFEYMMAVASELECLQDKLKRRRTAFHTKDNRDAYSTMVNGGILEGGNKINIIPGRVKFSIDRRLIPEETVDGAMKEIERLIEKARKRCRNFPVKIRTVIAEEPVVSKNNEVFFKAFSQAVKTVSGKKLRPAIMAGGTDLKFFMRRGVPCLGYSVLGAQRAHADNEFVYCRSIAQTTKVFALLMANLDRKKGAVQL